MVYVTRYVVEPEVLKELCMHRMRLKRVRAWPVLPHKDYPEMRHLKKENPQGFAHVSCGDVHVSN